MTARDAVVGTTIVTAVECQPVCERMETGTYWLRFGDRDENVLVIGTARQLSDLIAKLTRAFTDAMAARDWQVTSDR